MTYFMHHSSNRGVIQAFHNLVELAEAETLEGRLLALIKTDAALHLLNPDGFLRVTHSSDTAFPRPSATSFALRSCRNATMVAFTTLWGLAEPSDLVSTLRMPAA